MNLLPISEADLDGIVEIQRLSPESSQWHRSDYEMIVRGAWPRWRGWVCTQKGSVAGFLVARLIADELEILNLAVLPEARRCGVGGALLAEALNWGRTKGAARAFLEVRASNRVAIEFYEHRSLKVNGRRVGYYADPVEDALHLAVPLS